MRFPVVVNMIVAKEESGRDYDTVNAAVLDMHYEEIYSFANYDNNVVLVTFISGFTYKLQMSFEEMYNLYNIQHTIHEEFKPLVDMYRKDNLKNMLGTDEDEPTT